MRKDALAKAFAVVLAGVLFSASAFAGTVGGKLALANSSLPLKNATVSFTPSQNFYVAGSFLVVSSPVSCYTTVDGSITGLPDPTVAPTVTPDITTGTLPAGTYDVAISYYDATEETLVSTVRTVILTGPGHLTVTAPATQPANATGYRVYMALTGTTLHLQTSNVGWANFAQSTSLSAVTIPPVTNNSACTLVFNDQGIPTSTGYDVNVLTVYGAQIAGFPMRWYLYGGAAGTINVSNGYPVTKQTAVFPSPLLLNPPSNVTQSVNSPVTLNAYNLTANQVASTVATGTAPFTVNSTTVVPNLTVQRLNSSTTINTTNPVTVTTTNPANPWTLTIPDPGGAATMLLSTSANTVDCSVMTCKRSPWVWFVGGSCNNTTAAAGLDNFGGSAPTPFCVTGSNTQKGVLAFPAAVTWIQENNGSAAGAGTVTTTYPATTTAGNLLVAEIAFDGTHTITGCTDTTNAYSQAFHSTNGALSVDVWYFNGSSTSKAGGTTLTCSFSVASNAAIVWHEYSGTLVAAIADKTAISSGTGTAVNTGTTAATAQATELVLAVVGTVTTAPTVTAATNATLHTVKAQATNVEVASAGFIANATGAQSSTFTLGSSSTWAAGVVTFKANVAASVTAQSQYGLPSSFLLAPGMNATWRFQAPQAAGSASTAIIGAQVSCVQDGSTDDPAFNTATASTVAVPSTANTLRTTLLSSLTTTGCVNATAQQLHFQVVRQRYTVGDNFEGWIYLNGAGLQYGVSQ